MNKFKLFHPEDTGGSASPEPETKPDEKTFQADARELETSLDTTIDDATHAAVAAPTPGDHEIMSSVAQALELVRAELKRGNDLREFEQKKTEEALAPVEAPVAEVVEAPPVRMVRRGARKVKRK